MPQTLLSVKVGDLSPDPTQPRKEFRGEEIQRLADSIAARGVLTPLRVMKATDGQGWVIVTGESRWRAAKLAGLYEVPCIVVEQVNEADLLLDRVSENSVRHDLSALEFGRAVVKLKRLKGCTAQTLAKELGMSNSELSKMESLLSLPDAVQALIENGSVVISIGYEISRLHGQEEAQTELAQAVAAGRMNRKAVVDAIAARIGVRPKAKDTRLTYHLDGVAVSLAAETPLTTETLVALFRRLLNAATKLEKDGKPATDLAARFTAS